MSRAIISHIHVRVKNLAEEAIAAGLISSCDRNATGYLIVKPGELIGKEYTPIGAGVQLLRLLGKI